MCRAPDLTDGDDEAQDGQGEQPNGSFDREEINSKAEHNPDGHPSQASAKKFHAANRSRIRLPIKPTGARKR